MKSVKMFGKKIPILAVFLATIFLIGAAAIAAPVNAETQTVTGETVAGYTVTTTVPFGQMPMSSNKEITGVIVASTYAATIDVSVANTSSAYTTGVLTKLEYDIAGTVKCTIDAPGTSGAGQTYTVTGSPFSVASGNSIDLTAYSGTVAGVWDPVVITLTITPS